VQACDAVCEGLGAALSVRAVGLGKEFCRVVSAASLLLCNVKPGSTMVQHPYISMCTRLSHSVALAYDVHNTCLQARSAHSLKHIYAIGMNKIFVGSLPTSHQ
jgi:hypothetical protein